MRNTNSTQIMSDKLSVKERLVKEAKQNVSDAKRHYKWEQGHMEGALENSRERTGISYRTSEATIRNWHEGRIENARLSIIEDEEELVKVQNLDLDIQENQICQVCKINELVHVLDYLEQKCNQCYHYPQGWFNKK